MENRKLKIEREITAECSVSTVLILSDIVKTEYRKQFISLSLHFFFLYIHLSETIIEFGIRMETNMNFIDTVFDLLGRECKIEIQAQFLLLLVFGK